MRLAVFRGVAGNRTRFAVANRAQARCIDAVTCNQRIFHRVSATLWHRPLVGPMVLFADPGATWAVYLIAGQAQFADDSGLPAMPAGDSAIFAAGDQRLRHVIDGGGEALLIRIEPAAVGA